MANNIPDSILEDCIDIHERCVKDAETMTEYLTEDMPDCGEEINSMIFKAVYEIVDKHLLPAADEYIKDYFEPSAREEAMGDIRRETMERIRNESN